MEIKEILKDLDTCRKIFDYTITPDRCEYLYNYITSLQQENKKLRAIEERYNVLKSHYRKRIDVYVNLKQQCKYYKSIIETTIAYIGVATRDAFENDKYPINCEDIEHILDILRGEKKW